MRTLKNFIGGTWRDSAGGRTRDVNPADVGDVVADAPASTAAEAAEACEAAARAFEGWRQTPAPVRGQILYKVQRRMEERRQELAAALVSGNTVVFKPATLTPLTATVIVEIFDECGLPPGVLNLVYGGGRDVGDTIVRHPAILAVSFTGSNDVGVGLYGAAAARGIKCQCEMGGKNPIVVLADADLDLAIESTVQGAFGSTGQRCTATSRAVVVEGIADEFADRLAARTASLVVGNGLNPATHVGPSVDERQLETV